MRKNQKGLSSTLLIIAVVVVIVVAGMIFFKKLNDTGPNQQIPQSRQSSMQNSNDLNAASADLDKTDLNSLDNELNLVDSDASTF